LLLYQLHPAEFLLQSRVLPLLVRNLLPELLDLSPAVSEVQGLRQFLRLEKCRAEPRGVQVKLKVQELRLKGLDIFLHVIFFLDRVGRGLEAKKIFL
jgi:hypothetical protein